MPSHLEIIAVQSGRFARAALRAGSSGKVIAAFGRSFYVETEAGLACLGVHALGSGPLNVLLPTLQRPPPAGDTVVCDREGVAFGSGLRIGLRGAQRWQPPPPVRQRRSSLAATIARLREQCAAHVPTEGFGFLIAAPAQPAPLAKALPAVRAFSGWIEKLLRSGAVRAPGAAQALIGLGPGLTPSGDDLIGGALVALHACGRAPVAARISRWAQPLAAARTGRISRAHLACAAEGEAGASVHALLAALLRDAADLRSEIEAIGAVGHSSGWDAAAGVLCALQALADAAGER